MSLQFTSLHTSSMAFTSIFSPSSKPTISRYRKWAGKPGIDLVYMSTMLLEVDGCAVLTIRKSTDLASKPQYLELAPPRCGPAMHHCSYRSNHLCRPTCSHPRDLPHWRHHAHHMGLEGQPIHEGCDHAEGICASTGQGRRGAGGGCEREDCGPPAREQEQPPSRSICAWLQGPRQAFLEDDRGVGEGCG